MIKITKFNEKIRKIINDEIKRSTHAPYKYSLIRLRDDISHICCPFLSEFSVINFLTNNNIEWREL